MIILYCLLFIFVSIFSFYIPGRLLIHFLKLNLKLFENFIISWFLGISLFLLGAYAFSWIQMPQVYLYILVFINLYVLIKKRKIFFKFEKIDYFSLFIVLFGSLSFLYVMFFSGFTSGQGIKFLGVNGQDGIRHVAYIKNQIINFPPQHPGLSGEELKGFHYFYDFLLAKFSQFYGFSVENLYFRFFPLLASVLYGLSFYLVSRKFKASTTATRLIIFFAYFAQSFSIFLYFINKNIDLSYSAIVHPIGLIINPFIVLAIGMLIAGLALLPEIKKSYKYAILIGLIFGVLSQIKVYAGLVAIGAVVLYSIYLLLKYKRKHILSCSSLVFTTAIITAVTFLPNNFKQGGLVFYPLEFYKHYISSHGFEFLHWDIERVIFEEHNNYLRLIILYIEAILIFWIYNLGILSVVFLKAKNMFLKKFWQNDLNFILFFSILIPIIIASFSLQTVSAFDTVQFLWIAIPLFGIPAGIVLANFLKKNKTIGILIALLIVVLSLPGNIDFLLKYNPMNAGVMVGKSELDFYEKVKKEVPKNTFLIYLPKDNNFKSGVPLVSAISGIGVYLEKGNLPNKLNEVYEKRLGNLLVLNNAIKYCNKKDIQKNLTKIGSKYILSEIKYACLEDNKDVEKIDSPEYKLYIYPASF